MAPEPARPGPGRGWLLLFLLLLLVEVPGSSLFDQDETRYAEIGSGMLATGDWRTPRLNGSHYFEKPPLLHWGNAASMAALGKRPFAFRLPARLSALAAAAALLLLAPACAPRGTGAWAALLLLSAPLPFVLSRLDLTDGPLAACVTLSMLLLWRFLEARERGARGWGWLAAVGAALGAGVLAKGLVAIVLPGLALLAWAAITGKWRRVGEALLSPAPLLCAAVAAPWFLLMEEAHPGFNRYFWVENHFARFSEGEGVRVKGFWYPSAVLLAGMLPWTALLVPAAKPFLTTRLARLREDPAGLFLWTWLLAAPLFFAASSSVLAPYVLPSAAPAALLGGRLLAAGTPGSFPGGARGARRAAGAMAVLCAAVVLLTPLAASRHSCRRLADRAAAEEVAAVYMVRTHAFSLPLVLGRPVPVVAHRGEMATDGVLTGGLFPRMPEFRAAWAGGGRVLALLDEDDLEEFRAGGPPLPRVLGREYGRVLVANYPEERP